MTASRNAAEFFSASYGGATEKFLAACTMRGAIIEKWPHPLKGPDNAELATYTAYLGNSDAASIFMIVSGTHGLEGLAGSGCQLALLEQATSLPASVGYLFVHMLNPWGAAWGRRQNEDNIDLNRNFLSFGATSIPCNDDYDSLHDTLMRLYADAPEFPRAQRDVAAFIANRGYNAYVAALFRGQYTQSRGINFGGVGPTWSNQTLQSILQRHVRSKKKVMVVDLHTGLGPYGHGTIISTAAAASAELARLREWFGDELVSLSSSEHALPYEVVGDLCFGIRQSLPDKEIAAIALEFGTYEVEQLVTLQIEDCLRLNRPVPDRQDVEKLRSRLTKYFLPEDPAWFEKVTAQSRAVVARMLQKSLL